MSSLSLRKDGSPDGKADPSFTQVFHILTTPMCPLTIYLFLKAQKSKSHLPRHPRNSHFFSAFCPIFVEIIFLLGYRFGTVVTIFHRLIFLLKKGLSQSHRIFMCIMHKFHAVFSTSCQANFFLFFVFRKENRMKTKLCVSFFCKFPFFCLFNLFHPFACCTSYTALFCFKTDRLHSQRKSRSHKSQMTLTSYPIFELQIPKRSRSSSIAISPHSPFPKCPNTIDTV